MIPRAVTLARIVGLSGTALAREMQRSEVATQKLLSRALATLAQVLESWCIAEPPATRAE